MIKNIVFDIGRVLLDYDGYDHVKKKLSGSSEWCEVAKDLFGNEIWPEALDRGDIELDEAVKILASRSLFPEQLKRCAYSINEMYSPIESSIAAAIYAKNLGFRLYIISNFMRYSIEYSVEQHSFFSLFDGMIVSCYEGLLKPGGEIFELFLKRHDCLAEECLFIDDKFENVLTAKDRGFKTIHFTEESDLFKELDELRREDCIED